VWRPVPRPAPVDDASGPARLLATLPGMSIEMNAAEVFRLADTLRGAAGVAEDIPVHLRGSRSVGPNLQAVVDEFLDSHRAAGRSFAEELGWLAGTVTDVAHSWLRLDGALVPHGGPAEAE